jgi:hypothetical protein
MSGVTFIYVVHIGHNTLSDHGWRPDLLGGSGAVVDVCHFDGGRFRISVSILLGACHRCFLAVLPDLRQHLPGGPPSTFFTLMVGAPGSPSAPLKGSTIDIS